MAPECKPNKYEHISQDEERIIDPAVLQTELILVLSKDGTGILVGGGCI